jgi:hypothetical protein
MAFPSTTGSVPLTLDAAWAQARQLAGSVKASGTSLQGQLSAAGSLSGYQVVSFCSSLANAIAAFNQIAAISGIAAYAQAQIANASENITTDFTNMINAIQAVVSWIQANFPADDNGNLLFMQFTASGAIQYTNFTSAQLANLVTLITTMTGTIN